MITLTTEQAQQIEEALDATLKNNDYWLEKCTGALDTIRAARAQEQAEQEPVAWMWACTECGTEAEDGTDCRICSSCGYHKFYKAPKVATCVCAAKTQEQAEQEPVACPVCCNGYLVKRTEEYCNSCGSVCVSPQTIQENVANKKAAPVRTKELTDDEKFLLIEAYETQKYKWTAMDFIDAVIAADREKNK